MKHKLLTEQGGQRTFILVFATGDEVIGELKQFAHAQQLGASRFSGIGAFAKATLGYFEWDQKQYRRIPIDQQVELLSINGDIAWGDQGPVVHAHAVLGLPDGGTRGGHLLDGLVRPTLEMFLVDAPARLQRKKDPESGLALIELP